MDKLHCQYVLVCINYYQRNHSDEWYTQEVKSEVLPDLWRTFMQSVLHVTFYFRGLPISLLYVHAWALAETYFLDFRDSEKTWANMLLLYLLVYYVAVESVQLLFVFTSFGVLSHDHPVYTNFYSNSLTKFHSVSTFIWFFKLILCSRI